MRKNRRDVLKKERWIMIASSAFVLAALTMTGIYMKSRDTELENDGYTLDLAEMEQESGETDYDLADNETEGDVVQVADEGNADDAMDFMPLEVGSGLVEIPGLTDKTSHKPGGDTEKKDTKKNTTTNATAEKGTGEVDGQTAANGTTADGQTAGAQTAVTENVEVGRTLEFAESEGLLRPVGGQVLLPFSMDSSIYFSTLNHFKYNPALMLGVEQGTGVMACAEGQVVSVFQDAQIGTAVTMEIGNGYQITYGQLENVSVGVGEYVDEGQVFANVASPTKYFTLEGSNLYLKVTAEGAPVNPEALFR